MQALIHIFFQLVFATFLQKDAATLSLNSELLPSHTVSVQTSHSPNTPQLAATELFDEGEFVFSELDDDDDEETHGYWGDYFVRSLPITTTFVQYYVEDARISTPHQRLFLLFCSLKYHC